MHPLCYYRLSAPPSDVTHHILGRPVINSEHHATYPIMGLAYAVYKTWT